MQTIMMLVVVGSAIWVYFDARSIGAERGLIPGFFDLPPWGWALGCLGLWIVAFPAYLIKRPEIIRAADGEISSDLDVNEIKPSGLNRIAQFIAVGWSVFCFVGMVVGMFAMGKSAPANGNEYEAAGFAIGAAMGFGVWLTAWAGVAIPATVVYLVTRNRAKTIVVEKKFYETADSDAKKCPYCAELIKKDAIFCRHCHHDLAVKSDSHPRPATKPGRQPPSPPQIPVPSWLEKGIASLNNGEFKDAVAAISTAIDKTPTADAHYARAVAWSKLKERDKALVDLQTAASMGHAKAKDTLAKTGQRAASRTTATPEKIDNLTR